MLSSIEGVELNSKGYLVNFEDWNKDIALMLSKKQNLELTECHWTVINFLREYFGEYGVAPGSREIINKIGETINPQLECDRKHLENLFAEGGCKLACQIAGLPDSFCRGC
jgi:dissimilatory sulfite reductase related protein